MPNYQKCGKKDTSKIDLIGDNIRVPISRNQNRNLKNENTIYEKYRTSGMTSKIHHEIGDYRTDGTDIDIEQLLTTCSSRDYNKVNHLNEDYRKKLAEFNEFKDESDKFASEVNHYTKTLCKTIPYIKGNNANSSKVKETIHYNDPLPNLTLKYSNKFQEQYNLNQRKLPEHLPQSANPGIHDFNMLPEEKFKILYDQARSSRNRFDPKSIECKTGEYQRKRSLLNEKYNTYGINNSNRREQTNQNSSNDTHINPNGNNICTYESLNKTQNTEKSSKVYTKYCLIPEPKYDINEQNNKLMEEQYSAECIYQNINYDKLNIDSKNNLDDSINPILYTDSKETSRKTVIEIDSIARSSQSDVSSTKQSVRSLTELENNKVNVLRAIESGIEKMGKKNTACCPTRTVTDRSNLDPAIIPTHKHDEELSTMLLKQNQQNERKHHYEIIKREINRLETMEKEYVLKPVK